MPVNWTNIAHRLGFSSERKMWIGLYVDQKLSLAELAARFGVSPSGIYCALRKHRIPRRPRGGPNHCKAPNYDFLSYCAKHGIPAASEHFRVSIATVYYRLAQAEAYAAKRGTATPVAKEIDAEETNSTREEDGCRQDGDE